MRQHTSCDLLAPPCLASSIKPSLQSRLLLGRGFGVPISELVADAEAEVEQGREADEEADDGVEAFEGDDGDPAEGAVIGDGVAEKRGEGRKKGVHGSAVRRENEN